MSRLSKFKSMILSKIFGHEAEVERVFCTHKSIAIKMRASLSNDLVEKMLFVRYNSLVVGAVRKFEVMQEADDMDLYEALDDAEED